MSERIHALAEAVERVAAAMARCRTTPAKVEIIPRPATDRQNAARRTRLEDPKEMAVLKRKLGLTR
jgi:hypothetical protein